MTQLLSQHIQSLQSFHFRLTNIEQILLSRIFGFHQFNSCQSQFWFDWNVHYVSMHKCRSWIFCRKFIKTRLISKTVEQNLAVKWIFELFPARSIFKCVVYLISCFKRAATMKHKFRKTIFFICIWLMWQMQTQLIIHTTKFTSWRLTSETGSRLRREFLTWFDRKRKTSSCWEIARRNICCAPHSIEYALYTSKCLVEVFLATKYVGKKKHSPKASIWGGKYLTM